VDWFRKKDQTTLQAPAKANELAAGTFPFPPPTEQSKAHRGIRRVNTFFLLALAVALGSQAAVSVFSLVELRRVSRFSARHLAQAQAVQLHLTRLRLAFEAQVRNFRGFLLTGDPRYLELRDEAQGDFDHTLGLLQSLKPQQPVLTRLWEINQLEKAYRGHSAGVAEARRLGRGGDRDWVALANQPIATEAYEKFDLLVAAQQEVLEQESNRFGEVTQRAFFWIAGTTGVLLLVVLVVAGRLWLQNRNLLISLERSYAELVGYQRQLVRQERLTAIAELLASVVHELNNPLTSVIGFAQILRSRPGNESLRRELDLIVSEAHRATDIVHNLLRLVRRQPFEIRPINVNDVIEQTIALRRYELDSRNIQISTDLAPEGRYAMADPQQLQQVLFNLFMNAERAIAESRQPGTIRIRSVRADDRVLIHFSDSGVGIPPEYLNKVFQPFFTTKPPGMGTGLGLYISQGIVRALGGELRCSGPEFIGASESVTAGYGTTFMIELIAAPAPEPLPTEALSAALSQKRILVLEADPTLRELATTIFEEHGHEVLTAESDEEALLFLNEFRPDAVLINLKTPGMEGLEFYRQLRRTHPELARRVIFCSSGAPDTYTVSFVEAQGGPWIQKPYAPEQLLGALSRLFS
jgi:signal transduction histidine kinase/CheY-like chemotaxis protein